jgi:hypothetical protein
VTDIAELFVLLESQAQAIAGSALLTRAADVLVNRREVLVALDANGQKHLLLPAPDRNVERDDASRGVTLGQRVLRVDGNDVTYADLHCHVPSLGSVFDRLIEDVLMRLASDASTPVATCRRVLDEWRALLRAAGQELSRESIIGLVGELEVLRIIAVHDASAALDSWQGPTGAMHDFARAGRAIEVKTVTSVDGSFVSISNLDQLDPTLVTALHLVVVHARPDGTALSLDGRIDALALLGVPRDALQNRVRAAGYVYGTGAALDDRFVIRSVRAWRVGDSFPGLRRSELGEARLRGVSRVNYELALDSAPRRLSDGQFQQFLGAWLAGAE